MRERGEAGGRWREGRSNEGSVTAVAAGRGREGRLDEGGVAAVAGWVAPSLSCSRMSDAMRGCSAGFFSSDNATEFGCQQGLELAENKHGSATWSPLPRNFVGHI